MITSLIEMLRVTKLWSHGHIYNIIWVTWENFVGDARDKNYDDITFISKYLTLRRHRVALFAAIIKIVTMFTKTIFKDSKKVKSVRIYLPKCNLYLYFLTQQNLFISGWKMLMSEKLNGCVTWFIFLGCSLGEL